MPKKEELIEGLVKDIKNAISEMDIYLAQCRYDDVKSEMARAKLAIKALKHHAPEAETKAFEDEIAKLTADVQIKQQQEPAQTRESQLNDYAQKWGRQNRIHARDRLLGVREIEKFKESRKRKIFTWLNPDRGPQAVSQPTLQATSASTNKL